MQNILKVRYLPAKHSRGLDMIAMQDKFQVGNTIYMWLLKSFQMDSSEDYCYKGPVSYKVTLEDAHVVRHHVDRIRKCSTSELVEPTKDPKPQQPANDYRYLPVPTTTSLAVPDIYHQESPEETAIHRSSHVCSAPDCYDPSAY